MLDKAVRRGRVVDGTTIEGQRPNSARIASPCDCRSCLRASRWATTVSIRPMRCVTLSRHQVRSFDTSLLRHAWTRDQSRLSSRSNIRQPQPRTSIADPHTDSIPCLTPWSSGQPSPPKESRIAGNPAADTPLSSYRWLPEFSKSSENRPFMQPGRMLRIAASVPIRSRFLGRAIPSGSLKKGHRPKGARNKGVTA